jgi:hypothetical protein
VRLLGAGLVRVAFADGQAGSVITSGAGVNAAELGEHGGLAARVFPGETQFGAKFTPGISVTAEKFLGLAEPGLILEEGPTKLALKFSFDSSVCIADRPATAGATGQRGVTQLSKRPFVLTCSTLA